jgi:hypothetical protein
MNVKPSLQLFINCLNPEADPVSLFLLFVFFLGFDLALELFLPHDEKIVVAKAQPHEYLS